MRKEGTQADSERKVLAEAGRLLLLPVSLSQGAPLPRPGAGGWAQLPALPEAGVYSLCSESLTPMSHTLPFPSPRLAGLAKRSREVVFQKA